MDDPYAALAPPRAAPVPVHLNLQNRLTCQALPLPLWARRVELIACQ